MGLHSKCAQKLSLSNVDPIGKMIEGMGDKGAEEKTHDGDVLVKILNHGRVFILFRSGLRALSVRLLALKRDAD